MAARPTIWLLTGLVWLVSVLLTAALTFAGVMLVAGPHAGLLPPWLEAPVLAGGWVIILVLPVWISHRTWRRLTHSRHKGSHADR